VSPIHVGLTPRRSPFLLVLIIIPRMDRVWLLTNTCYGTWLPGAAPGFVGRVWEHRADDPVTARRITHNLPGTLCDEDKPDLARASRTLMKGRPIHLNRQQAEVLLRQLRETADFRGWQLLAVAVMFNHFHVVVGVLGDPDPGKILGDFKSWATRSLSQHFGEPASKTWWTERGSKRKLPDDRAVATAIRYVLFAQPNPLLTWSPETDIHFGPPPKG
jgi:REP element-mobilizing transposase RayT